MTKPLYDDPVVAEIHAVREKMLADCGGDLRLMTRRVRERQDASGRSARPAPTGIPGAAKEQTDAADKADCKNEPSPASR